MAPSRLSAVAGMQGLQVGAWRFMLLAAWALLLSACASGGGGSGVGTPPAPAPVTSPNLDPSDPERRAQVRLELATAYFANGQLDTALEEVRLTLQIQPNLADAHSLRAMIYAAMGDDAQAEDSFRRAIQINPRDGHVLHNRAWFLCQRNRHAEAQQLFDQVLALPQYRERQRTLLARGVCYARNQQWAEAEAAMMRAHELDPGNPGVGFSLAEVLLQRQQLDRARFYISRVNDLPGAANAQSLWLAVRIAHRLGLTSEVRVLGERLRARFPQSPEATQYDRGRFDD